MKKIVPIIVIVIFALGALFFGLSQKVEASTPAAIWTLTGSEDGFMVEDMNTLQTAQGSDLQVDEMTVGRSKVQIVPEEPVCVFSFYEETGYVSTEPFLMVTVEGYPSSSYRVMSFSTWLKLKPEDFGYNFCWERAAK